MLSTHPDPSETNCNTRPPWSADTGPAVRYVHHYSGLHFVETAVGEVQPGDVIQGPDGRPWMIEQASGGQLRARYGGTAYTAASTPGATLPVLRHNPATLNNQDRPDDYYDWGQRFDSEREFAERVLCRLASAFHVFREVRGTHYRGHSLRVDAVLAPRDPGPWKDDDPHFAVEFKYAPSRGLGLGTVEKWKAQAEDYTHTRFGSYDYLPIFLCVAPGMRLSSGRERRRLWHAGVGELVPDPWRGITLYGAGDTLWSEEDGPRLVRTQSISRKAGAR